MTLAFVIAGLVSCEETKPEEPINKDNKVGQITFSVTNESDSDVKSSRVNSKYITFTAGDKMSVFDGSSNKVFTTNDGGLPAMFSGTAVTGQDLYYTLFPYQSSATLSSGSITATLPASQVATDDSFDPAAMLAVGTAKENQAIRLKNVNALLVFTINDGADVASVTLKGDAALAGTVIVNPATGEVSSVTSPVKEVTMTGTFAPGSTYYFSVLPGEHSSFELSCRDSEGNVTKKEATSISIGRNMIHELGSIGTVSSSPSPTTPNYLCFTAEEAGSKVFLMKVGTPYEVSLAVSTDGTTWTDYTFGDSITLANVGDKVYFRNKSPLTTQFSKNGTNYYRFEMSRRIAASGNVMSLVDSKLNTKSVNETVFYGLFYNCTELTAAPELPATSLANSCYSNMFNGCRSLTAAPELPATSLANSCYEEMFNGCWSLTEAPELPATTLVELCYYSMFSNCINLTEVPKLPATSLASNCYARMFMGCSRLTESPELPATSMASSCYEEMFSNCTRLTKAPKLPSPSLAKRCYYGMFIDCTSLIKAPDLPATSLAERCYYNMFMGCTSLTDASELPATTLVEWCYFSMFRDCSSLTEAPEIHATNMDSGCCNAMFDGCANLSYVVSSSIGNNSSWLSGVAASGTFVCPSSVHAAGIVTDGSASTIPNGWVVINSDVPGVGSVVEAYQGGDPIWE